MLTSFEPDLKLIFYILLGWLHRPAIHLSKMAIRNIAPAFYVR
jgi:hypothetical protein